MLLFNPILQQTFNQLPIKAVQFLFELFSVEWTEEFHNSNEDVYGFLVKNIRGCRESEQIFSACLLIADKLLVENEAI